MSWTCGTNGDVEWIKTCSMFMVERTTGVGRLNKTWQNADNQLLAIDPQDAQGHVVGWRKANPAVSATWRNTPLHIHCWLESSDCTNFPSLNQVRNRQSMCVVITKLKVLTHRSYVNMTKNTKHIL